MKPGVCTRPWSVPGADPEPSGIHLVCHRTLFVSIDLIAAKRVHLARLFFQATGSAGERS